MNINFISEKDIDTAAEQLNKTEGSFDEAMIQMQTKQPIIFSYLFSENFKLLTKAENEYLLYLSVVIWKATDNSIAQKEQPIIDSEQIEEIEEKNWTLLNESKAKQFRDKLDVFFKDYSQEDLLAFVEDALIDDEDNFVTKEGKELLFIGLKTEIDVLTGISI